jgi:predicted GIY-YIG superfamily endonuclease
MRAPKRGLTRSNWTLYILEGADGSYFTGITRNNLKRGIRNLELPQSCYFIGHPERFPAKLVFVENGVSFKEAYAKFQYMRAMNRRLRKKLIDTRRWPMGGQWLLYLVANHKVEKKT